MGEGFWIREFFLKHSATLSTAIEKVVTGAEEGTLEALIIPHKQYTSDVCNPTYQNQQDEATPEWVVLAKNRINENLAIKVKTWRAEIIIYSPSSSKKSTRNKDADTVPFEIRYILRSMINELNSMMYQILTTCEQKGRDNAIQLIVKTLETIVKKTSENS